MKHPEITIRLGANTNSVEIDGYSFDRTQMSKKDQNRLRHMTVEAYRKLHKIMKGRRR